MPARSSSSLARDDLARSQPLLSQQAVSSQQVQHMRDRVRTARSALQLAERKATAAHAAVDGTDIAHNPAVMQARAAFRSAWVAAHRTAILAPVSGYVANRSVQVGQQVQPGVPLMQVIPLDNLWVDANFKEVQLAHIRIGQPATIKPDIYDGVTFHGKVVGPGRRHRQRVRPAAGAERLGQLDQGGAARAGAHLDQPEGPAASTRCASACRPRSTSTRTTAAARCWPAPRCSKPVAQTSVYDRDMAEADREADAIIQANLGDSN